MNSAKDSPATAVERAVSIMDAVALRAEGMSNSDLSRRLAIPKSSASYILRALERRGYLTRDKESGKYRLGLRILGLARAVRVGQDLRAIARPALQQAVERTGLAAHLAILDQGEAVYVEKLDAPGFIKMDTWVGRRMQVNTTSVGKVQAAYLSKEEVEGILRERGLRGRTSRSITTRERFYRELANVRTRGFAVDDEENSLGVRCVASAVFDAGGRVVGAVGVSGATSQITKSDVPRVGAVMKAIARRISRQLGAPRLT